MDSVHRTVDREHGLVHGDVVDHGWRGSPEHDGEADFGGDSRQCVGENGEGGTGVAQGRSGGSGVAGERRTTAVAER